MRLGSSVRRLCAFVTALQLLSCQSPGGEGGGAGGRGGTMMGAGGSGGASAAGAPGSGGATSGGTTGTGGGASGQGGSTGGGVIAGTGGSGPPAGAGGGGAGGQAGGGGTGTGGSGTGDSGAGGSGGGGQGGAAGAGSLTCAGPNATGNAFAVDSGGVTFTLSAGKERVQVCQADIIHVAYTTATALPAKTELSVSNPWSTPIPFCVSESAGTATITTSRLKVKVNETTGVVTYTDLTDAVVLAEASKSLTAATVEGVATHTVKAAFDSPATEALFGLGQHQDGVMNRKGSTLHMLNANTQIQIPVLVSNKGYGVFWDNYATTDFAGNAGGNTQYTFSSEAGDLVDYYFFYGPTIDQVVAGYRTATGAAPLYPKWAYGLFQSKDHYQSSAELLSVEQGYRNNNIPVDVIVQDWQYWSPYVWGSQLMDPSRYPDPAGLVNQLHAANVHTMISIWPLYQTRDPATPMVSGELDPVNALGAINALYPDTGGGLYHFYDAFSAMARALAYQYDHDRLLAKYGWDAIWADNTEPQGYPDGVNVHAATTALGKGAFFINAYPLEHNRGIYEGWRGTGPSNKRVYVLTRSAFAGQQRYAAGCWSGDINATASVYAAQIPGGLGFAISGMPYWTTDIGGYFGTPSEELFTRWLQFGAFSPTFRIHGQAPKELYGSQWSAQGKANMLLADNLRYRLMPYIYSLAWKVTSAGYTIMRPLVFDFQSDSKVYGIADQFMFGPALLVNPVTAMGATSRSVYLPAGTWYDFWTGATTTGGGTSTASAPLSQIPIYVRAGAIVPLGPNIQYATQSADPLEIRVYKGQSGSFTLYEDAGDTYDYESGQYAQILFSWDDGAQQLTIGARTGSYTGMLANRTFNVVWVGANHGTGAGVTAAPDQAVKYTGAQVVVSGK
ncbi:MAG TPA: glycoside hydrolase family 31 protein [Polyangia bacterium]|nr:glycoside hydrolase family 31 protein [Polyangia bacterium]